MPDPVILELAVNGATPRSRNRHVPRDPDEIAEVALAGVALGASIIHSHNDEPMFTPDGVHAVEPYLASWGPVLERHPELLMYPTMAAGARGTSGSGWRTGPGRGSRATWTCCALWPIWSGGWGGSRPRSATPAGSSASGAGRPYPGRLPARPVDERLHRSRRLSA